MSLGELIFPRACAGCGAPGEVLCPQCRDHLRQPPYMVARPRPLGAPVYALGPYSDIRRRIIIGMKERGNRPVREYVGAVFAAGLAHLRARGDIPREFTLIPAPTRPRSARARGGDPVSAVCHSAAQHQRVGVCAALTMGQSTADQSELNAQDRWENLQGRVRVRAPIAQVPALLADDVITTGATLAASIAALQAAGVEVCGGLVFADA
ncbi:ComF family protein [Corynebacterium sp.]|uniref:ComF family protein n=1 Tax=Corynebacterium sp. TaxID=1720 RepID=UPI001D1CE22B|nr:ComF family protein [Corynebacterium sp.]MBS5997485.1 ComF family protein [Corynebacterium sp.]